MPALMRSVGASSRGGFSMKAVDPPVGVGGHDAERRRVVDAVQRDRALGAGALVGRDQRADVEVGEDVAVEHEEALGDPGVEGGEADGAGRVARLGLDGVVEVDAGAARRRGRRPGRRRAGSRGPARPR